jgi:hypothetical protein
VGTGCAVTPVATTSGTQNAHGRNPAKGLHCFIFLLPARPVERFLISPRRGFEVVNRQNNLRNVFTL